MGIDMTDGHEAMDYDAHLATYSTFLKFTKYVIVSLVLLLAGMAYFLV